MNSFSATQKARRGQSGAAMVEFSILMLVFVPCLLYGFFLADASYHQLEVQEAVISTTWDFSQRNQQAEDTGGFSSHLSAVMAANRAQYNDHTSSFDDMNDLNGLSENHHNQLAVHACWIGTNNTAYNADPSAGASEVSCKQSSTANDTSWLGFGSSSGSSLVPAGNFATSKYNAGGPVNCWGRAWAYNFFVPEQFLQGFSTVNLSNDTDHQAGASIHDINGSGINVFLRDTAGLSFGTWAIDDGGDKPKEFGGTTRDIQFGKPSSNPFQSRVAYINAQTDITLISFGVAQVQVSVVYGTSHASDVMILTPFVADSALFANGDAMIGAIAGINIDPGLDPLMTFLVSRYDQSDSDHGHHPTNHCGWAAGGANYYIDVFTCDVGDTEYESTPTKSAFQSTTGFIDAFNNRDYYYMGSKTAHSWKP